MKCSLVLIVTALFCRPTITVVNDFNTCADCKIAANQIKEGSDGLFNDIDTYCLEKGIY